MHYKPVTGAWEITMGCNMRCKHCGSSCKEALKDELTTEEALKLCDEIGKLGLKQITLAGGEPTSRKDWHIIARRLYDNGVVPNIITNGWLIDEDILQKIIESKINTVGISIDGLKETHDFIRKKGSFNRIMKALDLMKEKRIAATAITTINKINEKELYQLRDILIEKGVKGWQLQIGMPMGTMIQNKDLVISYKDVNTIIEFAYQNINDNRILINLADCFGYFSFKDIEVRNRYFNTKDYNWRGCGAGKCNVGILHNGDIVGCTSIRNKEFIEGNIRNTSLKEIWNNHNNFKWNRIMKQDNLKGFCGECIYGKYCLGGCSNTRLCIEADIHCSNKYCSYYIEVESVRDKFKSIIDIELLYNEALKLAQKKQFQLSQIIVEYGLDIGNKNIKLLNLYGYVNFMQEKYSVAKIANESVLKIDKYNVYALKGLGLSLCRLGDLESGISFLKKSIGFADKNFMEPYKDLAFILLENERLDEAKDILKKAKETSMEFFQSNTNLYKKLEI